ncbi:O-antigen ligase family protein [Manganibacter manganicus]
MSWRTVECWGAGACLFLNTGAFFPLMLIGSDAALDEAAKAKLRLLLLPAYAFTLLILSRHVRQFITALVRNPLFNLLIAMAFVSVFWSISPSVTLRRATGLLFSVLSSYMLAICFTPRQLLVLVTATVGLCILLSLALLGVSPTLAIDQEGMLQGAFVTKNILGWYSSILAAATFIILMDGSFGMRRAAGILLAASLTCLAWSMSMTSIIATSCACFLIWFYSSLPKMHGLARAVFMLVFIQATVVLLILLHEFLVPVLLTLGKDATLTGRVPLWELVDASIGRRLMLGYGYQVFWTEANPDAWAIWSRIQWMAPHSHNGFRDTLLSFGLGGMALFAMIIARALRQGASLQCRVPEAGWLWLNVFMVMILVMNLTESIFLVQNDAIFILFATAIISFSLHSPASLKRVGSVHSRVRAAERAAAMSSGQDNRSDQAWRQQIGAK